MKKLNRIILLALVFQVLTAFKSEDKIIIENKNISREFLVSKNGWVTTKITNKKNAQVLVPLSCDEFKIRLSKGTDKPGTDKLLTTKDFTFVSQKKSKGRDSETLCVKLKNESLGLEVTLNYELGKDDFYLHKQLEIESKNEFTVERVDVESMAFEDAYQPYKLKMITTKSKGKPNWKPGLGQPLYTKKSGTFWGIEFPAATNFVKNKELNCGYLSGKAVNKDLKYTSYKSVVGVTADSNLIDEAFFSYIDEIRVRPLRLQVQYNSWFDFGKAVNQESFLKSANLLNEELVVKRNCRPLNAYVIDDGWQDSFSPDSDWSDEVWKTNNKFDADFKTPLNIAENLKSTIGLWLSPGVLFGSTRMQKSMKTQGYETLQSSMSLSGPKYMAALKKKLLWLTEQGISYYKFDGTFGHLRQRNFELEGRGTSAMPQLNVTNQKSGDIILNDQKYDELKTYYLVSGTEKLIDIFDEMAEINPNVYITISNGAYLSPWWLQHVDASWMINAGDAAKGSGRTDELTYRDGIYYEIWKMENTKFPMNAIFNHEPKKTKADEDKSPEEFQKYLLMNFSRGTGLIELYLKTEIITSSDWDILANGLKWVYQVFPTFKNIHMHGGNPRAKDVYGYSAWDHDQGYISFHNPSDLPVKYRIKIDEQIGAKDNKKVYKTSSMLKDGTTGIEANYKYGDTIEIELKPKEIMVVNFSTKALDWDKILAVK